MSTLMMRRRLMMAMGMEEEKTTMDMKLIQTITVGEEETCVVSELTTGLTEGMYLLLFKGPANSGTTNDDSIYCRVGAKNTNNQIFSGGGYRIANISTRADNVVMYSKVLFYVFDGKIIPLSELLYLSNSCSNNEVSKTLDGNYMSIYSQNSKVMPEGITAKLYKFQ